MSLYLLKMNYVYWDASYCHIMTCYGVSQPSSRLSEDCLAFSMAGKRKRHDLTAHLYAGSGAPGDKFGGEWPWNKNRTNMDGFTILVVLDMSHESFSSPDSCGNWLGGALKKIWDDMGVLFDCFGVCWYWKKVSLLCVWCWSNLQSLRSRSTHMLLVNFEFV